MSIDLETDAIFLTEVQKGHKWQLWAGFQFLKESFIVQVPPLKLRPTREEIDRYTDEGDLYVWRTFNDRLRLECKSRNISFTNSGDYPFDTAFVERVNTWKRKRKPAAILLISQITGAIVAIPTWTEPSWFVESANDSVRGYQRYYYMLKTEQLVNWTDFIQQIRGELPNF